MQRINYKEIKKNRMTRFSSVILAFVAISMLNDQASAFVCPASATRSATSLSAERDASCSRRDALFGVAAAVFATAAAPQPAAAKYSDYSRREQDWQARLDKGDVKVSSARDLRAQLQEIAPMNTSSSKIFCPNGMSANVSPLMENKCGDRMATPSVYGRSNDSTGNSVPGFKDGYARATGGSSSVSAAAGGFPAYKENEWKVRN